MRDPVELCARAVAGWHTSWLSALGLRTTTDETTWQALDEPPVIYFGGITLRPDAPPDALLDVPGGICDSWQSLELEPLGFRVWRREPWYLRPPGPLPDMKPTELEIVSHRRKGMSSTSKRSACAASRTSPRPSRRDRCIRRPSSTIRRC